MNDETRKRRYFIAEGAEADELRDRILRLHAEHRMRTEAFLKLFDTKVCLQTNGQPTHLLIEDGKHIPDGLKVECKRFHDDKTWLQCKPMMNRKAGKEIKKQMVAVGRFNVSDLILDHYDCNAMVYGGWSMWCATGWICAAKKLIVIQIPEDAENPCTPHPSFREIKKSEYVAITEE